MESGHALHCGDVRSNHLHSEQRFHLVLRVDAGHCYKSRSEPLIAKVFASIDIDGSSKPSELLPSEALGSRTEYSVQLFPQAQQFLASSLGTGFNGFLLLRGGAAL